MEGTDLEGSGKQEFDLGGMLGLKCLLAFKWKCQVSRWK